MISGYVELHAHSCFSLLDGVSWPESLVERAAEIGMPALALTDCDALYGAVRFWQAATAVGIKPILGAEITIGPVGGTPSPLSPHSRERAGGGQRNSQSFQASVSPLPLRQGGWGGRFSLTLLAETATGYANLSEVITKARLRSAKGQALATWADLATHRDGLIVLSGGRQGEAAQHVLAGRFETALQAARRMREIFGPDHFFIELQRQGRPGDEWLARALLTLAERGAMPVVATNDVRYATRAGYRLHDVQVAIRHLATLEASHHHRRGNSEAYLKSAAEMARLFADRPDALDCTLEIAARCIVSLQRGVQDLPKFPIPPSLGVEVSAGASPGSHPAEASTPLRDASTPPRDERDALVYLRSLCETALARRFGVAPGERARTMLAHELTVIGQLGLANYFLIVWDIMCFARSQGIRCQGRGSAANSLVAYLLEITPIDPLAHDLVFERFLSQERPGMPDIDIDFDALRREEVIQYVYQRYGREHAAMACTFVTFQTRSALRDIGRALGLPTDLIAELRNCENAEVWEYGNVGVHNSAISQSRIPVIPQLLQQIQA